MPVVDAKAFHKRRVQQVSAHRTSMEDEESEVVLEKLAKVVENRAAGLFEACVERSAAGRDDWRNHARGAHQRHTLPADHARSASRARPRQSSSCARRWTRCRPRQRPTQVFLCNMGSLREHKARADFSRGFFARGRLRSDLAGGFKTRGSGRGSVCQIQRARRGDLLDGRELPARWCRR